MASSTKNVKLGVCQLFFGGKDLGYTKGGVEVSVSTETHEVNVDQFGKTAINQLIMGRDVKVKAPLAETTLENMVEIMPGATLTTIGGTKASGTITIVTNPANSETITVNGVTVTFKTALTGAVDEVQIGANKEATAANLAAVLAASGTLLLDGALFANTAGTAIVNVTYEVAGVVGNAYTLATGTAAAKVTVSGATLTGGVDGTTKYVSVPTGIGVDLLSIAKELRLHPVGKSANDLSDDFIIPLAATAGALNFSYKLDDERIFNVEFMGYPDSATGRLFLVGGRPA